jgi:hypothetical protein
MRPTEATPNRESLSSSHTTHLTLSKQGTRIAARIRRYLIRASIYHRLILAKKVSYADDLLKCFSPFSECLALCEDSTTLTLTILNSASSCPLMAEPTKADWLKYYVAYGKSICKPIAVYPLTQLKLGSKSSWRVSTPSLSAACRAPVACPPWLQIHPFGPYRGGLTR